MLRCFLFLFLQLLNNQETLATRLYSSYNQDVSVPDSLLAPVSVIYRHRNNVGTVRRVERFGIGLSQIEELGDGGHVIRSYGSGQLRDDCMSTIFREHTTPALTTKLQRDAMSIQRRFTFPERTTVEANSTKTVCKPIEFLDTTITRRAHVYKVGSVEQAKMLCYPNCDKSTAQSPVFNETVEVSYKISNWYFCTATSCSGQVGRFLRLTFDLLYPEQGGDMDSFENLTSFRMTDQPPHCRSQYNRWSNYYGRGYYSSTEGYLADQVDFLSQDKLNEVCHNFSYVGHHGAGDDYRQLKLITSKNRLGLRLAEHVQGSESVIHLRGKGLQGPTFYKDRKIRIVIPKDSSLKYDILIDMNSSCTKLSPSSVFLLSHLLFLVGFIMA